MLDLAAAALAGLLGSAHCVGMCGGSVALLGLGDGPTVARRQTAYFAGKTLTYTAFGALAGAAGVALREPLAGLGGVLAVGLGAAMVAAGLAVCGVWPRRAGASTIGARLGPLVGRLVASERRGALVALGAVNGLLPCGLVYGMLAVAATTGGPGRGALTMAVFGLATVPALAATGWLSGRLRPSRRARLQRLAGVVVVAMGLLTVARGAHALTPAHDAPAEVLCTVSDH
ncbi:sulfite exporter TauE/SafE family protein [Rubrivirga sp. IMCC45206]|uniref:sulfite exporter TauE/SafE family protein n=1 Tax=Rubrivirga sp. IMCC45206 TaxID=3391614 RepID=UPI0039902576